MVRWQTIGHLKLLRFGSDWRNDEFILVILNGGVLDPQRGQSGLSGGPEEAQGPPGE